MNWKAFGITFAIVGILYVPFMICDFVYYGEDTDCVNMRTTEQITLANWFLVDALVRLACLVLIPGTVAILAEAERTIDFVACIIFLVGYVIYDITWLIVGRSVYAYL